MSRYCCPLDEVVERDRDVSPIGRYSWCVRELVGTAHGRWLKRENAPTLRFAAGGENSGCGGGVLGADDCARRTLGFGGGPSASGRAPILVDDDHPGLGCRTVARRDVAGPASRVVNDAVAESGLGVREPEPLACLAGWDVVKLLALENQAPQWSRRGRRRFMPEGDFVAQKRRG